MVGVRCCKWQLNCTECPKLKARGQTMSPPRSCQKLYSGVTAPCCRAVPWRLQLRDVLGSASSGPSSPGTPTSQQEGDTQAGSKHLQKALPAPGRKGRRERNAFPRPPTFSIFPDY